MKIRITQKTEYSLGAMSLMAVGIYLTITHSSGLLDLVWLALGGFYIVTHRVDTTILMLLFLAPFEMWLPVNILYFFTLIVAILKTGRTTRLAVLCTFVFVIILVQWICTTDGKISIMLKVLMVWVAVFYFLLRGYREEQPEKLCRAFWMGAMVFSVDVLSVSWRYAGLYVLESRLGGGQLAIKLPENVQIPSENVIGLIMAMAIISALLEMYYTGKPRYFHVLWFFITGLQTKSTTFLILYVVTNILYFIFLVPKGRSRTVQLVGEGILGFFGLGALYIVYPVFFKYFIRRLTLEDITNGRAEIFDLFNQGFIKGDMWNILLGYGTQKIDYLADGHGLHNGVQGLYVQYGIMGFLCVIFVMFYLVWMSYRNRFNKESFVVSLLPLLVFLLGIETMNLSCIWFLPSLLMLSLSKVQGGEKRCTLPSPEADL